MIIIGGDYILGIMEISQKEVVDKRAEEEDKRFLSERIEDKLVKTFVHRSSVHPSSRCTREDCDGDKGRMVKVMQLFKEALVQYPDRKDLVPNSKEKFRKEGEDRVMMSTIQDSIFLTVAGGHTEELIILEGIVVSGDTLCNIAALKVAEILHCDDIESLHIPKNLLTIVKKMKYFL